MANVIVCDRCKNIAEFEFITVGVKGQRGANSAFKRLASSYDLCPACAQVLADFFENRPVKID